MQQAIYIRHRSRVLVPPGDGGAPPQYLASLLKNLEGLGFTASATLMARLLADDIARGARWSVLTASRMGARLYTRLGYRALGPILIFVPHEDGGASAAGGDG